MRVDGVHIRINQAPELLVNSPELDFKLSLNETTGEIESKSAAYKGLFIMIYGSGAAYIRGSLHKYSNEGTQNWNELSHSDVILVVWDLWERFGIDPSEARITQIEIGVNIIPDIKPTDLLRTLILHKTNPFTTASKRGREFCLVEYDEYTIKAYDKIHELVTFRFEIAARKRWKDRLGIHTLSDLLEAEKYFTLDRFLLQELGKLLIIDQANIRQMSARDALNYYRYINPRYWEKLSPDYRRNRLKEAQKFIADNGLDKTARHIQKLIEQQIDLYQADTPKHPRFFTSGETGDKPYHVPLVFHHLDKEGTSGASTIPEGLCAVTGLDITHQRSGSKYLTQAGLRHLAEHNPEAYQDVADQYGPREVNLDQETLNNRIAHNIRNFPSNQWRGMRNLENKGNYSLFSNEELYGTRAMLALLISNKNTVRYHSNQE